MRFRLFSWFALAMILALAGCERSDTSVFTVEGDEPGYRRGKDLVKQGRNQEALNEFLKVIEKRGLDNAPESHLEVGILYQHHIKDPIAAIYHYRKFRELKPNSPQSDLVRQRIDAAMRDFARSLPGQPLENQLDRLDMSDLASRLQRENDRLKAELAAARAGKPASATPADADTPATDEGASENTAQAAPPQPQPRQAPVVADASPVQRAGTVDTDVPQSPIAVVGPSRAANPVPQPAQRTVQTTPVPTQRPATTAPANTRPAQSTQATRPTGSYRRHVISKGDTLYSLAQRYYGNRSRWRDIYNANRDVMRSPDDYKIGMELKIPQ
jgi:nucleoid-associated protein YgaU